VPKILPRKWTEFFRKFEYFASSVVVHRDDALMPPDRAAWRPINVRLDEAFDAGMLSVWMNAYNPSTDYAGNVFQSWYQHQAPSPDKTLVKADFSRVVHTVETPALHARLSAVQGRENFYFCGAYAVAGMGLLEQATVSSQVAARRLLLDTFRSRLSAAALA
jgi:predicted NAD/FAD-binding protein